MLAPEELVLWLGFDSTGDVGPYTTYTKNPDHRIVFFPRDAEDGSRLTPARQAQRDKFRAAAADWWQLTTSRRTAWGRMARKLSLKMTGYNVFVWWTIFADDSAIETLERQSGETLL